MLNPYLSWKYKYELNITDPSATEGLQVSFTLSYYPGMRYDFRDLRFTTKNGVNIPYFLENIVNFTSVLIWLRLPANTEKIYMYYGNGFVTSASSGADVFRFFDGFTSLNLTTWTKIHGSSSVSGGYLYVGGNSENNILESKATCGYNSIMEARVSHPARNGFHAGLRSTSSTKRADWYIDSSCTNVDIASTFNGSTGTYEEDIDRTGSTFYVYGVTHLNGSALFYVDHVLKKTITTTLPAVSLPIQFYSEVGRGNVIVDWVRIRTYSATMPTITLGKRYINLPQTYPYNIAESTSVFVEMIPDVLIKRYANVSTSVIMRPVVAITHPLYYKPSISGPYARWKYRGDVRINVTDRPVQVDLPMLPGMTTDGRDIRFSDIRGETVKYNIVSSIDDVFSIWVDAPVLDSKIYFHYGNGAASSESDESVTGTSVIITEYYLPEIHGAYEGWKYQGDIEIPVTPNSETVQRVEIPLLPGMGLDGRDLRFSKSGSTLSYKIESLTGGIFSCLVEWPAYAGKIHYHYGNGSAVSESDSGLTLSPVVTDISMPSAVIYSTWKYGGDIRLSETPTSDTEILIDVPKLPGMAIDGRDIRFSDIRGNAINYFIESSDSDSFSVWVLWPSGYPTIKLYYGNGSAVSESNAAGVFLFFDDFDTFDTDKWDIVNGDPTVSDSTLLLGSSTYNDMVRSTTTFGAGHILEMRGYHPLQNQMLAGFWHVDNRRAYWICSLTNYRDYTQVGNGSSTTSVDDGVNRGGTTYYVYRVDYGSTGCSFYINGAFRRNISTNIPTGNLPIGIYSQVNKGNVVVDWVRVRKATTATATVERHYPRTVAGFQISENQLTTALVSRHYPRLQTPIKIDYTVQTTTVERHYPIWKNAIKYYEYLSTNTFITMQADEPVTVHRRELRDYSVSAVDVSKSINDTYLQLSTEFVDLTVPPERATVKHNAYDSEGIPHLIFHGKVLTNSHTLRYNGNTVSMVAADQSINLSGQKIPWNCRVVDTELEPIQSWLNYLLEPAKTGVYANTIIVPESEPAQFVFDPKTTRLEAIKKIASYVDCIIHTKLITQTIDGVSVTRPEFYFVPPENIDDPTNGFDLPTPITLIYPDTSLADEPKITAESEEKYNKVTVYGTLSENGEYTVASAYSYKVYIGEEKALEYSFEDNTISEKGSTAAKEAIKWLLYFMTPRATVSMKFIDRFDLELYQRIRCGAGFPNELRALTNSSQVDQIAVCDPRDEANSTHLIDVSGVPRPSWLRISGLKYHSEYPQESVEVTAITDFIYSATDPVISDSYSDYLSPGYIKPILIDLVGTTQSIVDDTVSKKLTPEVGTVLSIDTENKTYLVQTASSKLVTTRYG